MLVQHTSQIPQPGIGFAWLVYLLSLVLVEVVIGCLDVHYLCMLLAYLVSVVDPAVVVGAVLEVVRLLQLSL